MTTSVAHVRTGIVAHVDPGTGAYRRFSECRFESGALNTPGVLGGALILGDAVKGVRRMCLHLYAI